MNKRFIGYAAAIFAALGAANAQATVTGLTAVTGGVNNDKMVSDSVLNVTWADAVPSNAVTPEGAQKWISELNLAQYGGYNDWRLATDNGSGFYSSFDRTQCINSSPDELACLFINELGNNYGGTTDKPVTNLLPFFNFNANQDYWSGTYGPVTLSGARTVWLFSTVSSSQGLNWEYNPFSAIAVRTGQTLEAQPPVAPIPAPAWLLISSIGGLGVFARKRKA